MIFLAIGLGILSWTFFEYVIHRWLGHDHRFRPNLFANEHTRHHSQGNYFAPAVKKIAIATVALALLTPAAGLLAGLSLGLAWAGGVVGMYLFYEWFHHHEHTHAGSGPYGRWARRHHFHHHFVDPSVNHGVTTPIWDVLFRTLRRPGRIPVPEKLAMRWLVEEASGDLVPRFAADYDLVPLTEKSPVVDRGQG